MPVTFADASPDSDFYRFVIFGYPRDDTSTYRYGSRMAPLYIRMASYNFESKDQSGTELRDLNILDSGDLYDLASVEAMIRTSLERGVFPVMIGGEHTCTIGSIGAVPSGTVYVYLDAHADFRDEFHGRKLNHACVCRRTSERHRVLHIGMRSISCEEVEVFEEKVESIRAEAVNSGLHAVKELISRLNGPIYISLDFDVLDSAIAPGVGNPEPGGLNLGELMEILKVSLPKAIAMDLVEVCPPYDPGQTVNLAAYVIRRAIAIKSRSLHE